MNDDDIAKEHKFEIKVDSEAIFELLNKYENDFKKTFKEEEMSTGQWKEKI